ncbi:MAG: multidrug ABC transporter ATP-binding protein, partial [Oscillospiraceae bacterium]|nr:multidrug ABC transporter ATP-binding protein [Oscillospiraceae bacterium]
MAENNNNKPVINLRPGGRGPGGPHAMGMPQEKAKNVKGSLKRILQYIGKNKHLLYAMLAVMLVATLLNVASPTIQASAIDTITVTDERPVIDIGALVQWLIILGGVYLVSAVLTYFQNIFAAKLSQYTVRIMRKDLFSRISKLPIKYIDTH